jgi:cytochrome d ubiquinol oxidase subunit I
MQTPAGYKIEGGKAVLTSFWGAALNPSTAPRYFHTIAAALITGCFVVAGVCAWYLLKKRHVQFARQAIVAALVVGFVLSLAMPLIGHWGALVVAEKQPVKMAAFENVTDTEDGATLWLVGWLTKESDGTYDTHGIGIPNGLSMILHLNPDAQVTGLGSVPAADRPPVPPVFQSYHLMIALGMFFALVFFVALLLHVLKRLENTRWMLWILIACIPLALLAINMGWMAAEVGRQPWVVQGLMRTTDGVSPLVSSGEIWTTLGLFGLIYLVLFIAWIRIFLGIIKKGPEDAAEMLQAEKGIAPAPAGAGR